MLDSEPLPVLQKLHLDEVHGGLRGLYSLLADPVELREKGVPPEKIRRPYISKHDLRHMLGTFIEKLDKMREEDDKAGSFANHSHKKPLDS